MGDRHARDLRGGHRAGLTSLRQLVVNYFHHNQFRYSGVGVFLWDAKVSPSFGIGASTFAHNAYYRVQTAIGGNGTTSARCSTTRASLASRVHHNPELRDLRHTNGPSMCAAAGAAIYASYTDVAPGGMILAPACRRGTVKTSAAMYAAPGFNTDPASPSFLVIPPSSSIYGKASDGTSPGIQPPTRLPSRQQNARPLRAGRLDH